MTQKAFVDQNVIRDIGAHVITMTAYEALDEHPAPDGIVAYPNETVIDVPDGAQVGWVKQSDGTYGPWVMPPPAPQTIFAPREFFSLFTEAEEDALFDSTVRPIRRFVAIAMAGPVDIANAEVIADIHAVQAAGLLTADRAAVILAGTPAPSA